MELELLTQKAFASSEARIATEAIELARQQGDGPAPLETPLRSYELVAAPGHSLEQVAQAAVPKLVYHLESLGAHPPACGGIFLSLFVGERVYFIHMRDALPLLAQALGRTMDALVDEFGTHELRHAVSAPASSPPRDAGPLFLPATTGSKT